MENQSEERLSKKVGDKELPILKPARITIQGVKLLDRNVKGKVKQIAILICKHPEKEESVEISKAKFVKGSVVKVVGLWYDTDEDELIQKGSSIAELLEFCNAESLSDLTGKEVDTTIESDSSNYLVIKAY